MECGSKPGLQIKASDRDSKEADMLTQGIQFLCTLPCYLHSVFQSIGLLCTEFMLIVDKQQKTKH
ncbi:hypothetical protein SLEP1_g12092 [Rubroshorea leprosula]|nr:hypothetical protein SLEP1_g12092 [Rubroshorea leprosula]